MSLTWQQVPGWFDWMDLYDEVALTTPPNSTIVEVGVAFGRSLFYLAQRIKDIGRPGVRVVAVDPWVEYPELHFIYHPYEGMPDSERVAYEYAKAHGGMFPAFLHGLDQTGLGDIVDIMHMTSMEALDQWLGPAPHFVFIDAHHIAEKVSEDLKWWSRWGSDGPEWMAGHDYNRGSEIHFPGVWQTVDAYFGQENVEWRGQTCWVVRRSQLEIPKDI